MTRVIAATVLLAAAAVGVLLWTQAPRGPAVVSGIIEARDIRVGSRVGGRVREVHVKEGDRARPGELLVTLEAYDLSERLAEAQAEWAARRANLEKLRAGYTPEEIAQAVATRDRYRAALDRLETVRRSASLASRLVAQLLLELLDAGARVAVGEVAQDLGGQGPGAGVVTLVE